MAEPVLDVALETAMDRFWETFPPVWNKIRTNLQAIVGEHFDITVEQFHVLRHVRKGRRSVSDLALEKRISRSAVSQAVDTLVEKGLLSRLQSTRDRRWVGLELTPTGDALLSAVFCENRCWMKARLARLSAEQMDGIMDALQLLKQTFDEDDLRPSLNQP
jgi:DNA-binding MarR family transcriptional regulator